MTATSHSGNTPEDRRQFVSRKVDNQVEGTLDSGTGQLPDIRIVADEGPLAVDPRALAAEIARAGRKPGLAISDPRPLTERWQVATLHEFGAAPDRRNGGDGEGNDE